MAVVTLSINPVFYFNFLSPLGFNIIKNLKQERKHDNCMGTTLLTFYIQLLLLRWWVKLKEIKPQVVAGIMGVWLCSHLWVSSVLTQLMFPSVYTSQLCCWAQVTLWLDLFELTASPERQTLDIKWSHIKIVFPLLYINFVLVKYLVGSWIVSKVGICNFHLKHCTNTEWGHA